jgi:hypothetical protein
MNSPADTWTAEKRFFRPLFLPRAAAARKALEPYFDKRPDVTTPGVAGRRFPK